MGILKTPRATTAERTGITPAASELIYDTDLSQMFMGDGVTAGGVPLANPEHTHTESEITDLGSYLTTETDPVFSAWDKSTGISITERQISDFGTYEPADATILKDADIGSTVQAYDADIPTVAASQAEMEAGTETALRSMSPANVKQAIDFGNFESSGVAVAMAIALGG
jgi:hypothetical protein